MPQAYTRRALTRRLHKLGFGPSDGHPPGTRRYMLETPGSNPFWVVDVRRRGNGGYRIRYMEFRGSHEPGIDTSGAYAANGAPLPDLPGSERILNLLGDDRRYSIQQ